MKNGKSLFPAILGLLLIAGCASTQTPSGFLGDYSALKPVPGASGVLYYEKPTAYPVVYQPGVGVLRIRAAITDIIPANPLLNIVTTAAVFIPLDMGGAAMEAEFLDSVSNERLAAIVDRKQGSPLSPLDIIGGFTKWGHAKGAFDKWAKELREALDEAHGK